MTAGGFTRFRRAAGRRSTWCSKPARKDADGADSNVGSIRPRQSGEEGLGVLAVGLTQMIISRKN